jgi:hypothetical protein
MKLILAALLTCLATQAFAQSKQPKDLKQEIAKCANSDSASKRLACFDALAERLGIVIPNSGATVKNYEDPLQLQKEKEIADYEQQSVRKAIVDEAIKEKVIQKITFPWDSQINIWVSPKFSLMQYELKNNLIGIVRDFYTVSGKTKGLTVSIIESKTGNNLGFYTPDFGLRLN